MDLKEKLINENWSEQDIYKLISLVNKHGDNWDEIEKEFAGSKSKNECITQFLQLPIKENAQFKVVNCASNDVKTNIFGRNQNNIDIEKDKDKENDRDNETAVYDKDDILAKKVSVCSNDLSNPLIAQISFFTKMFEKFVDAEADMKQKQNQTFDLDSIKEIIYKTYSKTVDNCKKLMDDEKSKMKMILDLIIYTQMKKIELKLEYFNEFEKIMEFESGQLKTMETQLMQERVKLALKRFEFNELAERMKTQKLVKDKTDEKDISNKSLNYGVNINDKSNNHKADVNMNGYHLHHHEELKKEE